jgi:hypothetical protein
VAVGAALTLAVLLIVYLVVRIWRRRRRQRRSTIVIPGEHGELVLRPRAVRDFIIYSLDEFRHSTVRNVWVLHEAEGYQITVELEVAPKTQLRLERDRMQAKIMHDLTDSVGVRAPVVVHLHVVSTAGEARQTRLA